LGIEEPVTRRYSPAFHCHSILPGLLGPQRGSVLKVEEGLCRCRCGVQEHGGGGASYTPLDSTASTRPTARGGWSLPMESACHARPNEGLWGESKATHRRGDVPSSRLVGPVAPIDGATPPGLAGGGHGLMRLQEVARDAVHEVGVDAEEIMQVGLEEA
jgi:hypothetical protein